MPTGKIVERFLDQRLGAARIACPRTLVPAPGQFLLARDPASDAPLALPVFPAGEASEGFLAASSLPRTWLPGMALSLRGPLGRGFSVPVCARRIALAALDASPAYLLGLVPLAMRQDAAISLICDDPPEGLPADVEIHPLAAFPEICQWADYLALAVTREAYPGWHARLHCGGRIEIPRQAQVLIITSMPCGGLAQCGVCSIEVKGEMMLVCEDGPVFYL